MKNSTALLVLNYNSQKFLQKCLNSLLFQNTSSPHDIYLIDNHSSDHSLEFVQKKFPEVKIISLSKNLGIGHAFNYAVKKLASKYQYFVFLNPDLYVDQIFLDPLINTLSHHRSVAAVSSLILHPDHLTLDHAGGVLLNKYLGIFGGRYGNLSLKLVPLDLLKTPSSIFFATVTAMAVPTQIFLKLRGFDESYFMYFEDIDYCWRAQLSNYKILLQPQSRVYHYGHGSVGNQSIHRRVIGIAETNLILTYYKNLPVLFPYLLIIFVSRSLISIFYLFLDPFVFFSKVKGIFTAFNLILSGRYYLQRQFAQSLSSTSASFSPRQSFNYSPRQSLTAAIRWFKYNKNLFSK